jgi:hypothetical protein
MSRRSRKGGAPASPVIENLASAASPAARSAETEPSPQPPREICPALEPWVVDEAVCADRALPPHEAIEARARQIWETRGRPVGADLDIWLEAQGQFVAVKR